MPQPLFHTKSASEVLTELHSSPTGLQLREAESRLKELGPNKLPEGKIDSLLKIFLRQFQSPLIYILMGAAVIVYFTGHFTDAAVVFFVLVFNAITGSIQEGRAQSTLAALKKYAGSSATVLRGGKEDIVSDEVLVPGDVIVLQEGEKIPADCRILECQNLQINEAGLTGESEPVRKQAEPLANAEATVADQTNMLFKGTYIVGGSGKAVVAATGLFTEIGKIAKEISKIDSDIPLKKDVERLSQLIVIVVLALSMVLMVMGLLAQMPLSQIFTIVVSLAISIIPEGLPIVMTLILAKGVWDMSKRNVLVKKLQAVEALGQTKIIAVDKTGTLTKNEMAVKQAYSGGSLYKAEVNGYEPKGAIESNGEKINAAQDPALSLLGRCAALTSGALLSWDEQAKLWKVAGDPTEAALLVFSEKIGQQKEALEIQSPKILEIPFDYKTKFHAVANQTGQTTTLTAMGAAETILEKSSQIWSRQGLKNLNEQEKNIILGVMESMAKEGLRVVAAGFVENFQEGQDWEKSKALTFAGLYGIQDALRPEVQPAMQQVREAGMKVVMITGDHKLTAQAIAKQAGIFKDGDLVISGEELNRLSGTELAERLPQVSVFVRVTPEHKLNIVRAYKQMGLVVAMTGDGVNDAPSLVAADLGVGMGKIGTEVAKEASDIVLLDDNFGSIVAAVEEGRNIYKTIQKAMLFLFSTAFGEVLIISSSLVLGAAIAMPMPLLPAQILWVNLVGDGILGIFLSYEPKEEGLLSGGFKKTSKYIVDFGTIKRLLPMALLMAAGTVGIFYLNYQNSLELALAMSFTTLAMFQWFNAWNCKSDTRSIFSRVSFQNTAMTYTTLLVIGLHLFALYTPFMQKIFHTVPLGPKEWLAIIPVASSIIIYEEIIKFFRRRRRAQLSQAA